MGLGGGFLATIYDASTGRVRVLNARERAPAGTTIDMFKNKSTSVGGLTVAVPGELRGYGVLHREYGRLPWRELVKPTADLCRNGHHVNKYMARCLRVHADVIKAEPSMREIYVNAETGEVWHEGNVIVESTLANTLDIIAMEGPEAMHSGSLAARLVADIRAFGGIMTEKDLRDFQPEWQEPIRAQIDDTHTLYTSRLPGSGSVLAFIINMLTGWVATPEAPTDSPLYWHRMVESFKYAYAKRTGLGDPSHTDLEYDVNELEKNLSNAEWARSFRNLVDDKHTFNDWHHYGGLYEAAENHGTAHSVVIAPDGSAVSVTSTINWVWGSFRRSPSLGMMLNNEMDDFSIPNTSSGYGLPPSPANMLAPGKRALSSMVPSLVLNKKGAVVLATGGAGGTKITTQIAMVIRHTLQEEHGLKSSMDRPRLHHQLMPMHVDFEYNFHDDIIESLRMKGHAVMPIDPHQGFAAIVSAHREADGRILPLTDLRRPGSVDGF